VPKRWVRQVERGGYAIGPVFVIKFQKDINETVHGVRIFAGFVREYGQGEKRAVYYRVPID